MPPTQRKRTVRCHHTGCTWLFEASTVTYFQFQKLFMEHGWRLRGTVTGLVHYCPHHVEEHPS